MRKAALIAALLLAALATACSGGGPREVEVEVGFRAPDGTFQPLEPGGDCRIHEPAQPGYWVMPTIRVWDGRAKDIVGCSLYDFDLEVELGASEYERRLQKTDEDWMEVAPYTLFLSEVDAESFPALHGHQGELDCYLRAADDSVEVHTAREVRIVTQTE